MSSGNTNGDGITTRVAGRLLRRTSDYTFPDPFFSDDEDAFTRRVAARTGRMPFPSRPSSRGDSADVPSPCSGILVLKRSPEEQLRFDSGAGRSCATGDRWIELNLRYLFMARHHNVLRALLNRRLTPILCVGAPSRGAERSVAVDGEGSGGEDGG